MPMHIAPRTFGVLVTCMGRYRASFTSNTVEADNGRELRRCRTVVAVNTVESVESHMDKYDRFFLPILASYELQLRCKWHIIPHWLPALPTTIGDLASTLRQSTMSITLP